MADIKKFLLAALIRFIIPFIVGVLVAGPAGHWWGSFGKILNLNPRNALELEGSSWEVRFDDYGNEAVAELKFLKQRNGRVEGVGSTTDGRKWDVEGLISARKLIYNYHDSKGDRFSFGSVLVNVKNDGDTMTGKWMGWSPESDVLEPRLVQLTRQKE